MKNSIQSSRYRSVCTSPEKWAVEKTPPLWYNKRNYHKGEIYMPRGTRQTHPHIELTVSEISGHGDDYNIALVLHSGSRAALSRHSSGGIIVYPNRSANFNAHSASLLSETSTLFIMLTTIGICSSLFRLNHMQRP